MGDVWIVGVGLYLMLGVWDQSRGMEPLVWRGRWGRRVIMSKMHYKPGSEGLRARKEGIQGGVEWRSDSELLN